MSHDSTAPESQDGFRLTGRHVFLLFVAFFGVVFAVNGYMMRVAVATFSGVQTETPYKMGLAYNTRIAAAQKQDALGWSVEGRLTRDGNGRAAFALTAADKAGRPVDGLAGRLRLERPSDKRLDHEADLAATGTGRYGATLDDVQSGQWDVIVELQRGGETVFESTSRLLLP
ncbi:FixH family protein [Alsobacter sp. R-9]